MRITLTPLHLPSNVNVRSTAPAGRTDSMNTTIATYRDVDTSSEGIRALIVDDEPDVAGVLSRVIKNCGEYETHTRTQHFDVRSTLLALRPDVLFLDLVMPDMDGFDVLREAKETLPELSVIIVSTHSTVENAVRAIKQGAFDFMTKPFDPDSVSLMLAKIESELALRARCRALRTALETHDPFLRAILGDSPNIHSLREWILKVRGVRANVLIEGESGTGKELVARAIHGDNGPFIAVNMAAIPDSLADSELFGHRRGAFTGANTDRNGLILEAHGGTLFLDEANAMSPHIQAKLLRAIQEQKIRPVGSDREIPIDVRIISATNTPLDSQAASGDFRRDLYHRLRVLATTLPPLRERPGDIPLLAQEFLERYARRYAKRVRRFSAETIDILQHMAFPGNIRQLENMVEEAVILTSDTTYEITPELISLGTISHSTETSTRSTHPRTLADAELAHIQRIMRITNGNKTHAAKILNIDYKTLLRKLSLLDPGEAVP